MKHASHFSEKRFRDIERKIRILQKECAKRNIKDPQLIILDNADFMQLLKISHQTSLNWRNEGLIPYSSIKKKIYFKLSDIQILLDQHRVKRKR